jgi:Amt family ammonium transporter
VVVVVGYSFVVSLVLAKLIDLTIGLRVSEAEEYEGLDASQHAESAYDFAGLGASTPGIPGGHSPAGIGAAGSAAGSSTTAAVALPRAEVSK